MSKTRHLIWVFTICNIRKAVLFYYTPYFLSRNRTQHVWNVNWYKSTLFEKSCVWPSTDPYALLCWNTKWLLENVVLIIITYFNILLCYIFEKCLEQAGAKIRVHLCGLWSWFQPVYYFTRNRCIGIPNRVGQILFIVFQVERLSATGEEALILTASSSDGSLTQFGSTKAEGFLQKHTTLATDFLSYCNGMPGLYVFPGKDFRSDPVSNPGPPGSQSSTLPTLLKKPACTARPNKSC